MITQIKLILSIALLSMTIITFAGDDSTDSVGSTFTGETQTLLFVSDIRRSVAFYKVLGFEHDYYYDYEK